MVKQIKNLTENIAHSRGLRPFLFRLFFCLILTMGVVHIVLVGAIANEAADAKRNEVTLRETTQAAHEVESEYFVLSKKINLAFALKAGFTERKSEIKYVFADTAIAKR